MPMLEQLRRHPFLFAYWLAACNRLRDPNQWRFVAGGLIALVSITLVIRYTIAPMSSPAMERYALWAAVLAALYATAVIASGRRRIASDLAQSWLAATPRAAATVPFATVLGALWPLIWQASLYVVLILALAMGGVIDTALVGRWLLLVLIGTIIGAGAGWYLGRARPAAILMPLRASSVSHALPAPAIDASLDALAGWPLAQVMAWADPKALRWPFAWASLTVSIGASAVDGLLWIAAWAVLFDMMGLLVAVASVATQAGRWLRVTPLPLWSFARGLLRRALWHQLIATILIGVVLLFAYGSKGMFWTLYVWSAVLTTILGIAVIAGRNGRDVHLTLVFAAAAVLLASALNPILAVPTAVLCGAWTWWRGREE